LLAHKKAPHVEKAMIMVMIKYTGGWLVGGGRKKGK